MESRDAKDGRYQRLRRRHVYLHRLAGDDVFATKIETQPKAPFIMVIRFAIYAFIATFVIKARSQVEDLSIANDGTKSALTEQYFELEPRPRKFDDIKDVKDVQSWLRWLFNSLQAAGSTGEYSNPLSLNLHNRVTPTSGICLNASSITLSFRRVKLSSDAAASTTARFAAFYPQTWKAFTIDPGADVAGSDIEATSPIVASTLSWLYTPACKGCSNAGYNQMGGYIAVATTSTDGTLVHLVDSSGSGLSPNPALNHCDGNLTRSGTVSLEEFLGEPFFDSQLGSLTAEFQTYNANFQSLTKVKVFFQFSAAGALFAHRVETQTLQLDISHSWIQYFEYTYLVFTCFYFFDLVYRIGKGFPTYLQNFWCYVNACSIIASIGCFGIWYSYMPTLDTFRQTRLFQDYTNFDNRSATFGFYIVTSSFAVFTIYLRMLQFLGHTRSRVVLLLRTITFSAGNMIIYIMYIGVIFIGFSTFALTNFSSLSSNFTDPWVTFVSTFSLFMGDLSVMDGFNTPLKVPFMWLFMFFFFFLSVQMFNAIINYAYNRVSEDMKSVFQREILEKEMKKKTKAASGRMFWPLPFGRKPKPEEQEDGVAFGGAVRGPDLATLDPAVRQKVEEYRERDTKKSAKDGICTALVYFVMVGCYIGFLYVNMLVEEKNQLRLAIEAVVRNTEVTMPLPLGTGTAPQSWDDISTWSQVASWMQIGLPAIIFNSTAQAFMETTQSQLVNSGMKCLRSWNCLITGASQNQTGAYFGSQNIARITQKRSKRLPNRGSRSSATPEDERFVGGFDESGNEIQGLLLNESGFFQIINPEVANNAEDADLDFQLLHQNQPLCQTVRAGASSYRQSGGIVCELSSEPATFQEQIDFMLGSGMNSNETDQSSFFVKESASFAIELVAHNPNRDMLSYIVMTFYQTPAGKVHKDIRVFSLALFGWDVGVDKLGYFIGRLAPGAIYMTLVVGFTIMLYREMQTEHTRRSIAEGGEKGHSLFTTIFTFFASDVFRPVDAISYLMSFWSFVLFILWLVKEGDLQQKLQGSYGGIVDFTSELITTEKDYNRISAANLLLLFVRPLRFIREDPRMQRLNQTLHDAKQDIFWFIVVLSIVLFACTLLANVSFGPFFLPCIDIAASFLFCFSFILGEFDFWGLYGANPVMAVIFFFPYLILVYCVFTNIFFAILDRFFVSADPPPIKLKRKLKPLLSKICRCIDWDDDFVMEEDPKGAKKEGPQSRADRVAVTAKIIHDIRKGIDGDSGSRLAQSKPLSEVCDMDEKLLNVVKWSKEEASSIVSEFQSLLVKKQRHKNEDVFLKQVVMKKVDDDETNTRKEMEEAHRQMRYAAEVHEVMALRDQQTLAKYIWLLEQKIQKKMTDKHALMMEVQHLQDEMDRMRFTKEDLRNHANGVGADMPQEEVEGSESEDELETMNEATATPHVASKPIDPNSAMDSVGRSDPATADMLKALHG